MNENNQTHQSLVIDNYSNELFTVDKHSAEVIVKPEGPIRLFNDDFDNERLLL